MSPPPAARRRPHPSAFSDADRLIAERARRQRLTPATRLSDARALPELLRALQPVAPRAFTFPGTPPQLAPRVAFDDLAASEDLRRRGALVKGRFGGGKIAYVWSEDLPLFVAAYRRPHDRLSPDARVVLSVLESEGPTVRSELKALLELPGRSLSAALLELQRAFLVTELQYETEWDNAWTLFDDEFPGVSSGAIARTDALDAVIEIMLGSLSVASDEQLRDRSGLTLAAVRASLARLAASDRARTARIATLGKVWITPGASTAAPADEPFEAVLQPQDPLVLAERGALARRYGRNGVLAYIVIDGRFAGAAFGRWGISPFDVEDVRLDAPFDQQRWRQHAIVEGLRTFFPPPAQRIRRWLGEPFEPAGEGSAPA